ncbi:Chromosome partitioning ATPase, Mrp family, contains Fe-S cluster [Dethiosulfatibacter aminovorans DSM 17477]|uniref:Iron-sulfur cluster carrier protein n=1 Tax=Dethiosulfatibacter aminovorans DSM 17477 TaxID=1121476 RepID=A0A1M6M8H8_9FIRM|nr:Mrp/NBP35 family ATP-binding protein [Dethiosulfatibacter aminovorans]SHJ79766.1 Chromosome partitioning ATPase, Mrp family, contains Fe-S cluster [Dethiosulfatibacter aminovorans DSM 17477]
MADNCNSCPSNGTCSAEKKETCMIENNPLNNVKHIIGVMSGKGGVGKSTVSAVLAYELLRNGFKVGLMDADITGPSIPRLVKLQDKRITSSSEKGMLPITAPGGLKVMSTNFLVENEDSPVLWRGPIIGNLVKQFWTDVIWGDLDYLIVDMPPGTADVAITAMQSMPMSGIVMVTIPQDMVSMIVSKAVNMANKMNVPVLGVIENMSYIKCPNCSETIDMFEYNDDNFIAPDVDILCKLPMCKELINFAQKGILGIGDDILSEFNKVIAAITKL